MPLYQHLSLYQAYLLGIYQLDFHLALLLNLKVAC